MASRAATPPDIGPRSGLLIGGLVLIGISFVLGLAGFGMSSAAVVAAARRYVDQMEVPPRQLAKQRWHQAKVAAAAGSHAWREANPHPVAVR